MIAPATDGLPRFDADRIDLERRVVELERELREQRPEIDENTEFRVQVKSGVAVIVFLIGLVLSIAAILVSFFGN